MAEGLPLSAFRFPLSAFRFPLSAVGCRLSAVGCRLSAVGCRRKRAPVLAGIGQRIADRGYQGPGTKYPLTMKILISLAVVAAIAAIVYKVLTTEIPIDES